MLNMLKGKHLKKYLDNTLLLNPLGSIRYVVPAMDKSGGSGGSGANFLVEWKSDALVNPPVVETIMIGTQNQQGVSFTSRGQVLSQSKK